MKSSTASLSQCDVAELASARIARGARRLLHAMGYASVCELTLPNGRRADIVALSGAGRILIIEIKSSRADFVSDRKWREYEGYCDEFFFAVAADGPARLIPEETGLMVADGYAGEILRPAPAFSLAPARRRAMLLAFARHAALRLHSAADPDLAAALPR